MHDARPTSANRRRFSSGDPLPDAADKRAWKFDTDVWLGGQVCQRTAYIGCRDRGRALDAFFALHRAAKVFGTGLSLTSDDIVIETGRQLGDGEVRLTA